MKAITESPFFGIVVSIFAYQIGLRVRQKINNPLVNPLLIAIILVIAFLWGFGIPLSDYERGGNLLSLMLAPTTALLSVSIYRQRKLLWENLPPVIVGCFAGAATSLVSIFLMCRLFGLNQLLTASIMPKSVTAPVAIELAQSNGGIASIAVAAVSFSGTFGSLFAPTLLKWLKIDDPVAAGTAIGTSSHAIGTARALELGEIEGAISGTAIGIAGAATALLYAMVL